MRLLSLSGHIEERSIMIIWLSIMSQKIDLFIASMKDQIIVPRIEILARHCDSCIAHSSARYVTFCLPRSALCSLRSVFCCVVSVLLRSDTLCSAPLCVRSSALCSVRHEIVIAFVLLCSKTAVMNYRTRSLFYKWWDVIFVIMTCGSKFASKYMYSDFLNIRLITLTWDLSQIGLRVSLWITIFVEVIFFKISFDLLS